MEEKGPSRRAAVSRYWVLHTTGHFGSCPPILKTRDRAERKMLFLSSAEPNLNVLAVAGDQLAGFRANKKERRIALFYYLDQGRNLWQVPGTSLQTLAGYEAPLFHALLARVSCHRHNNESRKTYKNVDEGNKPWPSSK